MPYTFQFLYITQDRAINPNIHKSLMHILQSHIHILWLLLDFPAYTSTLCLIVRPLGVRCTVDEALCLMKLTVVRLPSYNKLLFDFPLQGLWDINKGSCVHLLFGWQSRDVCKWNCGISIKDLLLSIDWTFDQLVYFGWLDDQECNRYSIQEP